MELEKIMNSPGMWFMSSIVIIIILSLSFFYFRIGIKRANEIGISKDRYIPAIRSAAITSLGPSISPIIVLITVITIVGAPTAWMRLNEVGAARTELAMVTMSCGLLGIDPSSAEFGVEAFSYSIWGMALNDMGWFVVAFLMTHRMGNAVDFLYEKYDKKWINMLMMGATFGVTGYLLSNQIISKFLVADASFFLRCKGLVPALISATTMLIICKFLGKHQRLQELALGISMLVGMLSAQIIYTIV